MRIEANSVQNEEEMSSKRESTTAILPPTIGNQMFRTLNIKDKNVKWADTTNEVDNSVKINTATQDVKEDELE